jgi:cyclohexanecarboxylate-CoA ligase
VTAATPVERRRVGSAASERGVGPCRPEHAGPTPGVVGRQGETVTITHDYTEAEIAQLSRTYWPGRTLLDHLDDALRAHPDKTAVVEYRSDRPSRTALTYRELSDRADAVAAALAERGVGDGDVVSAQLPNRWELGALHIGCLRAGAITNLLLPAFRERELEFMLRLAGSKVLVTPASFRGFDHRTMAEKLATDLPDLQHLVVLDDEPDLFAGTAPDGFERRSPHPDEVIQIAYTSGTTGEPKGVLLTSNVELSNVVPFNERLGLTAEDVYFAPSPLAHQTGFLYGFVAAVAAGATTVLQDVWNPERATDIIAAERATFSMASTPFLHDLTAQARERPDAFESLSVFLCGGAPIPRPLVEQATAALSASVVSTWGMTEVGAVTLTAPGDPAARASGTDGRPLPGVAIRVVDDAGDELSSGTEGNLEVRACSMFGGYLERPEWKRLADGGWFSTGDLGTIDDDGFLRITGRVKDLIVRGGENLPVAEIEGALYRHDDVEEVAVVAMPDARLSERACAFVRTRSGNPITLDELQEHLLGLGMAKAYLPERVEHVDAMPRTSSGKVQKFRLRERAAAGGS